jgi:autotransporter passenger strand-loop-strand repeat protein/uncharacterized repeat protein (TIGR03803 family)
VTIDQGGSVYVSSGGGLQGSVEDDGTLTFYTATPGIMVFSGALTGSGSLVVQGGGTLQVSGGDGFTGSATISAGATLELTSATAVGNATINFGPAVISGGTLKIDGTTMPTNVISGLAPGDTIDLAGVSYNPSEFTQLLNQQSNQLVLYANGNATTTSAELQLDPSQSFFGDWFEVLPDGSGGTKIQVVAVNSIQINIVLGAGGYGTLSATVNGQTIPGMQATVSCAYDDLNPIPEGTYTLFYRTNSSAGDGNALEFDSSPGVSELNYASGVQIHLGNTPGDSIGCIVFGNNYVNGQLNAGSWTAFEDFFDSIASPTAYANAPGFYPAPVTITATVSGDTTQPTLEVIPEFATLESGASETITFTIVGLQPSSPAVDKDINVYFQVIGATATQSLVSGAALLPNGSTTQWSGQSLPNGTFEVTIVGSGQNNNPPGSAGVSVTLNTAGLTANSLSIQIVKYDGVSEETNGKVITYAPTGITSNGVTVQPLLLDSEPASITLLSATTTVSAGQTLNISSGQTISGIVDLVGGVMNVVSGGTASGTTISGGVINVAGAADDLSVSSGGVETVSSGGTDSGTTIDSGGTEYVFAGGIALDVTLTGLGSSYSSDVAQLDVDSGASLNGATVNSGGYLFLEGGASATNYNISSGGHLVIENGFTLSDFLVDDGVGMEIKSAASGTSTFIDSGGELQVWDGGSGNATEVASGSTERVFSSGDTVGTSLQGSEFVYSGGQVSSTTVLSGGTEYVSAGGTASGTVVSSGGVQIVSSGGVVSGVTIDQGGSVYVSSGGGLQDSVEDDGTLTFDTATPGIMVFSGALTGSGSLVVQGGGTLRVSGGDGFTGSATISAGATLELTSATAVGNATINFGPAVNSGGTLKIDGTTMPTNTISINPGDTIDLAGIAYKTSFEAFFYASASGGTLQIVDSAESNAIVATLEFAESLSDEEFTLGSDGASGLDIVIGKTAPTLTTLNTLVSFNGTDGQTPHAGLIADAAGDLFGVTFSGGANSDGTVFEIAETPTGYASTPIVLTSFNGSDGAQPNATLMADANGDLFGTTYSGGANGDGTVFEIAKTPTGYASSPITLVTFNGTNGQGPAGNLIADAAGDLFGTTAGANIVSNLSDGGTVFEIPYDAATGYATTPITLASFNGPNGDFPQGSLFVDADGNLIGTTRKGGAYGDGNVFEIVKTASGYASGSTTLFDFNGTDGSSPFVALIADADGDLFGTTNQGGASNDGTVFEIVDSASGYASAPTVLVSFNGTDGLNPLSNLIADAAGDLFGTAQSGGSGGGPNGYGTVFEVLKTASGYASTPTVLASFGGSDGAYPTKSTLFADVSGDLFGGTEDGGIGFTSGSTGDGTLFELSDTGFQSLAITSAGGLTNQTAQTITGAIIAADAGLTVSIYDGATLIGTATPASDGSWSTSVTLLSAQGAQSLTAQATDAAGNVGTSSAVTYTLDTIAPSVAFVAASFTGASAVTLSGTSSDNINVAGVEIFNGTTDLGAATLDSATGTWTFSATLAPGAYVALDAEATDAAGNTATATLGVGDIGSTLTADDAVGFAALIDASPGYQVAVVDTDANIENDHAQLVSLALAGHVSSITGTGVTGQAYSSYEYAYNASGVETGASYFLADGTLLLQEAIASLPDGGFADTFSGFSGQPYSSYETDYDASGQLTGVKYFFTAASGEPYSSYEYDYSPGNDFIGSKFYYTGITGEPYTGYEYDYDGGGHVTRVDFTGVTGLGYSSYEYDFVGGLFSGSKFEVTTVPTGATYSSYELDYNAAGVFTGDEFFFTNLPGQSYTGEEEDFDANGALTRVLLTGVTGQAYSSLEEDFSAGTYTGYKAYYTGITGQSYTGVEVDVSATNQLEKVVYTGMSSTPYSSVEQDYSAGALTDVIYDFTNVSGASAYAYQVEDNSIGVAQQEIFDNNDGSHTIIGLGAAGQTFTSIADDTFTGGGADETFVFTPIFGSDTITDFASYLTGSNHDTISLSTSEFANFAAVLSGAQNVGANTVITATNGDTLTLANMTTSALAANQADFTFHA